MESIIIIESPNKISKIEKYSGFKTFATVGHFMDLKTFDREQFKPKFEMMESKQKSINYYINQCRGKRIYIATDPDREGYAIGYMFYNKILKVASEVYRAEFHEITESGVQKGLKEAIPFQSTNKYYYHSFLGRRVGDMLIGFDLSSHLAHSIKIKGLSAGRVQTPALSLIVLRQEAIENFEALSEEEKRHYQIQAEIPLPNNQKLIIKEIDSQGKEVKYENREEAENKLSELQGFQAYLEKIDKKIEERTPPKPFITSSFLKECSTKLKIGTDGIQQIAQKLFEAGLITYIRTDSESLSQEFLDQAEKFYQNIYHPYYQKRNYNSKNSQAEAHEAIRITHCHLYDQCDEILDRENITESNAREAYKIIFRNTLTSQGANAKFEKTSFIFTIKMTKFKATSSILIEKGFLGLFPSMEKEKEEEYIEAQDYFKLEAIYPATLKIETLKKNPPPYFTEATFIETLEKNQIGRPSTYASYIPLLLNRGYIELVSEGKKKVLKPTLSGRNVIHFFREDLNQWILDIDFTKEMEEKLDLIARNDYSYFDFMNTLRDKLKVSEKISEPQERKAPSEKQIAFAEKIAKELSIDLPQGYNENIHICITFIDKHIKTLNKNQEPRPPSEKQIAFAEKLAEEKGLSLPANYEKNLEVCKKFIDKAMRSKG